MSLFTYSLGRPFANGQGGVLRSYWSSSMSIKYSTQPQPAASQTGSWVMPNMVGSNLQVAQNAIQKLTGYAIFFTKSHDATGRGRSQILDRDWTVCAQNIAPGATITTESKIDFAVVKLTEHCP